MAVTTKVTELSDSRVRLDAEVPGEEVESRVQRAAREIGSEMRIPGFRKGKVPGPMVIQRMGREAVLEQAVRDSLPEWYEEALMRSGVTSIGEPKLDMDEMPGTDEPLRFSIEVGVTPKANLGDYKGLETGRREPEVPAEAIDQELERLREPLARVESVDRPLASGDLAVVDFVGRVDGEPFEGGTARDYMLELGTGQLVEGFEEQLIGAEKGETRTIAISFPEEYRAEDLAGKDAEFEVEVKDVQEKRLPDLDDDFASEASEFDTVDELRADIEHKLRHAQEHSIEDEFRQAVLDAAVAQAEVELPDELVTARAEEMWDRTAHALQHQGLDPDAYLQATGKTREEMVEETREDAARQLARESVLEAVADAEDIEISDDELMEALGSAAEREKSKPAKLLERLQRNGRDIPLRRDLRLRKALDVLADSAQPIDADTAKAREEIWTPEKQRDEESSAQLWTPGSEKQNQG
jgi:trigger factor